MKSTMLATLAALTLGGSIAPAFAQYYGDDDDRPRRRYEYRDEGDYPRRPPPGPGYYERERVFRREGFGRVCVTARGNCPSRPAPLNSYCGCQIPGFGPKRGQIGY
ncbi:hypothetical protein [Methylobacterium sp. JK268]